MSSNTSHVSGADRQKLIPLGLMYSFCLWKGAVDLLICGCGGGTAVGTVGASPAMGTGTGGLDTGGGTKPACPCAIRCNKHELYIASVTCFAPTSRGLVLHEIIFT
jgi:hypothetical protein